MLPQAIFADAGTAAVGTIFGGAYSGPDVDAQTNLAFLDVSEDVWLRDAIAQLASGAAPAQQHVYLVSANDLANVVGHIFSTQVPPNSNLRVVPRFHFARGTRLFIRGVQISGAQEATQLVLTWSKEKPDA
jgi:hypothetical protein